MKKNKEKLMKVIFMALASISIIAVILICLFLFINGFEAFKEIGFFNFILGKKWKPTNNIYGILPMIYGSILVTLLAVVIAVPIGVLTAIYLAYFVPKKLYNVLDEAINLMAGIPSVVYGFFGLVVLVPLVRNIFDVRGMSVLTSGILLSIMILPTIISVSKSSLITVDESYYLGALALGASKERSVFKVLLPSCKSGVFTSIVLGIGKAIGETTAIIMVAGNQAIIPKSILQGVRTLTTNIVLEMGYATDLHRSALIATAVILFIFTLIINISLSLFNRGDK